MAAAHHAVVDRHHPGGSEPVQRVVGHCGAVGLDQVCLRNRAGDRDLHQQGPVGIGDRGCAGPQHLGQLGGQLIAGAAGEMHGIEGDSVGQSDDP